MLKRSTAANLGHIFPLTPLQSALHIAEDPLFALDSNKPSHGHGVSPPTHRCAPTSQRPVTIWPSPSLDLRMLPKMPPQHTYLCAFFSLTLYLPDVFRPLRNPGYRCVL